MIVAVGAVLRLIALGHKSFWIDEIASVAIARRATPVFWHFLWHDEGNMAAYYVLLRPWLHLGYGEGTVRLLSVIPGILSIPLMYVLGRRLFGRDVGIVAALFLALNACADRSFAGSSRVQLCRAGRAALDLSVCSVHRVADARDGCCVRAGRWSDLLLPLLRRAGSGGAFRGADRVTCQSAAVEDACCWRRRSSLLIAAPILWLIHAQDTGHISWVQRPSFLELYHLGAFLAADSGKAVGAVLLVVDLALVGVFLKSLMSTWNAELQCRWRYSLVASLVATPIVLTLLVSIVRPAFYHRFLIICLPGWVLMTAVGAQRNFAADAWRRSAIAVVCALSLVSVVILQRRITEDWRGAVNYLIANGRPAIECCTTSRSVSSRERITATGCPEEMHRGLCRSA